jgi:hypothetical protein
VGLDKVPSWTTQWSADNTSVRITYSQPMTCRDQVDVVVFRAVDTAGNMIGGPQLLRAGCRAHNS